jgi:polysaccharide pyruvyl transferase WcaK-like protein
MTGPLHTAPRVGLFGLLGSGNSGNDASMETVLAYLRDAHPDAVVDVMSGGRPDRVRASYGLDATPMTWYQTREGRASGVASGILKILGKGLDVFRVASWVRRHDAVIVPGAGALETTLPQNAWGFPLSLYWLCLSGKLFGTKVALVSVGADAISRSTTRWLSNSTARLAFYRSYRDSYSLDAMRQRGIDVSADEVYPDLVFGVPTPPFVPGDSAIVGVGVMAYYGGDDDRRDAERIHASYVEKMTRFTRWLVDNGHQVRLFGGDGKFDGVVAERIVADLHDYRPDLAPTWVTAESASSYGELIAKMTPVGIVVATRYHNVMCALKLCKPTISLGYSRKFVSLMADMGLAEFNQLARSLDVDTLIKQFKELESHRPELQQQMADRNTANRQALDRQFSVLAARLFPALRPAHAGTGSHQADPTG